MCMSAEWVTQSGVLKCDNCGREIEVGEVVVGDFDKFFHKDSDSCD